jgi:hypothetical protein
VEQSHPRLTGPSDRCTPARRKRQPRLDWVRSNRCERSEWFTDDDRLRVVAHAGVTYVIPDPASALVRPRFATFQHSGIWSRQSGRRWFRTGGRDDPCNCDSGVAYLCSSGSRCGDLRKPRQSDAHDQRNFRDGQTACRQFQWRAYDAVELVGKHNRSHDSCGVRRQLRADRCIVYEAEPLQRRQLQRRVWHCWPDGSNGTAGADRP